MSASQVQLSPSRVAGPSSSRGSFKSIPYVPIGPQASTSTTSNLPHPPLSEALPSGSQIYHTLYSVVVEAPGERPRVVLSQNPLIRHGTRFLPIDNPVEISVGQPPAEHVPPAVQVPAPQVSIRAASPAPSDAPTEIDDTTPPPPPPPPAPKSPLASRRSCSPTAHAKKYGVKVRDFLWDDGVWQKKIDDFQKKKREEEAMARAKTEEVGDDAYLYLSRPRDGPGSPGPSTSAAIQANPAPDTKLLARSPGRIIVMRDSSPRPTQSQPPTARQPLPSTSDAFSLFSSQRRSPTCNPSGPEPSDSQTTPVNSQPELSQQDPTPSEFSTPPTSQPTSSRPRTRKRKADSQHEAPQPTRSSSRIRKIEEKKRETERQKEVEDKLAKRAKRRKL
ncbi:hypothetical protein FRC02_007411, partial [Tulasnella sp. 418]